jgi:hypothetical protein
LESHSNDLISTILRINYLSKKSEKDDKAMKPFLGLGMATVGGW